ncbi:MAG: hypothetical protein GY913_34575 [Proteobacteria bacterium]|nr:hypothetical protein [Pseudomonadota bacterium]MCP4922056.1 hypothetical protein [Pseudomonadota bacterium]
MSWTLLALTLTACGPQPASVTIQGLDQAPKEGDRIELSAQVLDGAGAELADQEIAWAVTPTEAAQLDGQTLVVSAEGPLSVTASVGEVLSTVDVVVQAAIVGEYERETYPLKGMRLRIGDRGGDLVAEITRPPNDDDEARAWSNERRVAALDAKQKKALDRNRTLQDYVAALDTKSVRCNAEYFAVGLHKLRDFKRVGDTEWEAQSLGSGEVEVKPDVEACEKAEMSFDSTMVISLQPDGSLEIRDIASADESTGARQRWVAVESP